MGHIQYYQQYAHQPLIFRSGANNAFHEAAKCVHSVKIWVRESNWSLWKSGWYICTFVSIVEKRWWLSPEGDQSFNVHCITENTIFTVCASYGKVSMESIWKATDLHEQSSFLKLTLVIVWPEEIAFENLNESHKHGPNLQKLWDSYRLSIQGLVPPTKRSEKQFDPGAKFHIAHNTPYIRYFFAYILQFQFYRRLCLSGEFI